MGSAPNEGAAVRGRPDGAEPGHTTAYGSARIRAATLAASVKAASS
jgi:hypothetical protein